MVPALVCLNETFLDKSIEDIELEGCELVARTDRDDGRLGGGIAVYALRQIASQIALLERSSSAERMWLLAHTDTGPYAVALWYRPPDTGEVDTIKSLRTEWEMHKNDALGFLMVGDLNVHHARWLRFSSRNSEEGVQLKGFCDEVGLRQIVKAPTRGDYLLDLAITDMDGVQAMVLPKIADRARFNVLVVNMRPKD